MTVSRRADYAIRMMMQLAREPDGVPVPARTIGSRQGVPVEFARAIASDLASAGLLKAKRGTGGGIRLSKDPCDISVYDILRAVDGGASMSDCTSDPGYCERSSFCPMHQVWRNTEGHLEQYLSTVRLDALVSDGQFEQLQA